MCVYRSVWLSTCVSVHRSVHICLAHVLMCVCRVCVSVHVCVLDCELRVRVYTFVNMYAYIPVCVRLSVNACSVGGRTQMHVYEHVCGCVCLLSFGLSLYV